ncbi:peptidoglycan DD-metalloendopeptidase family protein [Paraburkholderia acidisoli]|uniref:Peptidoglycan DD-metalloendopeptidase family protein n=1 Tax=Paraburkholderia acidisoli TaxID=2571748 RepID=A0A7Z2GPY2_9BURK|nr:peptidoglycan DD-metalloendopeptidase family protein [Paraburkholderia acidisoli]QGZ65833.1 peptidoglycan DD-metalloendopeptidase family protein [Paraburkholderia acidisoli]
MTRRCLPRGQSGLGFPGFLVAAALAALLASGCATDNSFNLPTYQAHACVSASAGYYCVQPGDSLASVAGAFGRREADLAQWNGMTTSEPLLAGQMLRVGPLAGNGSKAASAVAGSKNATIETKTAANAKANADPSKRFIWPVSGTVVREFDTHGARGIEIEARAGTPVKAVAAGRVVYAGDKIKDYGLMVIVKHDDHFVTAYGNNRRLLVAEGATVARGAPLAEMGVHGKDPDDKGEGRLQFEMRENGQAVDPLAYLPADSGPLTPWVN